MDLGLNGAVALVTGAKGNIGQAICTALRAEGVQVIATDMAVGAPEAGLDWHALDVTNEQDWRRVIDDVRAKYGRLDILVNNAGIAPTDRIDTMPLADFRRAFDINVAGVFLGTQVASALLAESGAKREGGSAIINIASGAADKPAALNACYCATKAAVSMFTRATALEFSTLGMPVRVNAVHPGAVASDMMDSIVARYVELTGRDKDELKAGIGAGHPMGRMVEPAEVADAVVFLASRAARYTHAGALHVDGGQANT